MKKILKILSGLTIATALLFMSCANGSSDSEISETATASGVFDFRIKNSKTSSLQKNSRAALQNASEDVYETLQSEIDKSRQENV